MGGGEMMRAGRMLAQGDLRLIALALIAEQPRHGYEIIKLLEDRTAGWYSPSPGIVYPTLTYLEEAGYVTAQAEGAKKLYTITEEGRAHLAENRDFVDAVLERLSAIGEKATRIREHFSRPEYDDDEGHRGRRHRRDRNDAGERSSIPPLVRAALENLRDVAARQIEADEDAETKIVEVLARAAQEMKKS
jgi:DNA-binding PadR family transcriptional regulator